MAQIALDVQQKGLKTHQNPLALPPGSLLRALNVVIDEDNVIRSARGFKGFGAAVANVHENVFGYKGQVLAHYNSALARYSVDGTTITPYSGTYAAISGWRMKSMLANRNFYFTTDEGVKKLDAIAASVVQCGGIKALDGTAALSGSSGFMSDNTAVAYRIVWGFKDANENLILGSPSQRITVSNSSGGTRNVDLTFTVPDGITTSHFYQIYRSSQSVSSSTEANDELQLVVERNPTSAEITAKLVTAEDSTPDSLRGASLYTNHSQQGIGQSNEPPPLCKDMTNFRGMALYANTETKQRIQLNILAVDADDLNFYSVTGDTTASNNRITNVSDMTGLAIGQRVSGSGIPSGSVITDVNVGSSYVDLDQNATATAVGVSLTIQDRLTLDSVDYWAASTETIANQEFEVFSAGTASQNIADTARSLVRVINRQTSGGIYAYYLSGYDDLPGKILIEDRSLGGASWAVTSSKGSAFSPEVPESGTDLSSSNEVKQNGVFISKTNQPEAVPLLNYVLVGSADDPIKRIIATRDSVFVFKSDGIFRITGDTPANLQVSPFDDTAVLKGEATAVKLNNQVYGYFDQGVCAVSDSGVQVISRDVEKNLLEIFSSLYPNAESAAFGVGYESERKYYLWTVSSTTDTYATQAWVYNTFTNSWTRAARNFNCGFVNPADDKMYMGDAVRKQLRIERKTFTVEDYAEDEYDLTISAFTGTVITVSSTASAVVGQSLAQSVGVSYNQAKVTEVIDATHLMVDREVVWSIAAAKLYDPIPIEIEWAPLHGGQPGIVKKFPEVTIFFREANFREISLYVASNMSFAGSPAVLRPITTGAWGLGAWGLFPWGGGPPPVQPIRTYIPMEQQRANWINMSIEHTEALTSLAIAGFSNPLTPTGTRIS